MTVLLPFYISIGCCAPQLFIIWRAANIYIRVTTCLENPEMSENLTAVREMLEILLKVGENVRGKILSGKSSSKLFIVSCIFASLQEFSTSTGRIRVTLNMPSAAEECRKLSGKYQGISHYLESGHPYTFCSYFRHRCNICTFKNSV